MIVGSIFLGQFLMDIDSRPFSSPLSFHYRQSIVRFSCEFQQSFLRTQDSQNRKKQLKKKLWVEKNRIDFKIP
jgi:hypothetical protein